MRNQNKTLVLSSLLSVCAIPATGSGDWKAYCERIPVMQAQIEQMELRNTQIESELKRLGLELPDFDAGAAVLEDIKRQFQDMLRVCDSATASSRTFVGSLRGFETLSFYKRLSEVFSSYDTMDAQALKIDAHAQARLLDAAQKFMRESLGLLNFVIEKDEVKKAAKLFDLRRTVDDMTLVVIEMLQIDTQDVHDVDTLFARINARLKPTKADEL